MKVEPREYPMYLRFGEIKSEHTIPFILKTVGYIKEDTLADVRAFEEMNHIQFRSIKADSWSIKLIGIRIDLRYSLKVGRGNDTFKAVKVNKEGLFDMDVFKEKVQDMINLAGQRLLEKQAEYKRYEERNKELEAILNDLGLKPLKGHYITIYNRGQLKFNVGLPEDHFVTFGFDVTRLPHKDSISVTADGLTTFLAKKLVQWCRENIGEEIVKGEEDDE